MYRGRLWTMRQFAGFGTAEETNERFRYLLDHGQTGLSTAFDMPSLMGHDSDHRLSLGEVGREGVAVDTLDDMETLFQGIPLDEVTVSMTINAPAAIMLAFYVVAAEEQGHPAPTSSAARSRPTSSRSTSLRRSGVSRSTRRCDSSATWSSGARRTCRAGIPSRSPATTSARPDRRPRRSSRSRSRTASRTSSRRSSAASPVDDFAPRLSFFFNAQIDFFEEIAKYRAARRIWARELRETYGAKNPKSWLMRFHTQTAGVSLTAQQPLNNIARTAIEALAGVLGGTQSLHTNSYDEALALPTEDAVRIALRTQQIIAHETGVTNTIDPLGGSYFVESLTDKMEAAAYDYFRRIDELGGMVEAVKMNFPQREIADAAYELQGEIDDGKRIVVGVNAYKHEGDDQTAILQIDPALEQKQLDRLQAVTRAARRLPRWRRR